MEIIHKKIKSPTFLIAVIALVIGLSACQPVPDPINDRDPQPAEEIVEPVSVQETAEDAAFTESVEIEAVNECLICHSDQQALIDTAIPTSPA